MCRELQQANLRRKNISGKQVHEKMLNLTTRWGNANQDHDEIVPHPYQNG